MGSSAKITTGRGSSRWYRGRSYHGGDVSSFRCPRTYSLRLFDRKLEAAHSEVKVLMSLLKRYLKLELDTLLRNNIRFRIVGRYNELPDDVRQELSVVIAKTAKNTGMVFNIALNYGGRAEIVDAARRVMESDCSPSDLDEQRFAEFLYTGGQPDPDLLIRTSGEMRVSNFLLWQIAYAEI